MLLSLEALQIIDAIARKGSFAAAASELQRVPSALTYSVRKLEEDLDVLLFDRRGYRAKLTAAGEELLEHGRDLLDAASELERRVQRTGRGWEVEIRLALDNVIAFERLIPLIQDFDREMSGTRLRFSFGILSGVWEALLQGRADIVLGVTGPDLVRANPNLRCKHVINLEWVFAVAPEHPLAKLPEPLAASDIRQHRVVAVGDSGHSLPSQNYGLLSGQETLTVATSRDKLLAQVAGLGCGHLPLRLAAPWLAQGRLVAKQTQHPKPPDSLHLGWRKSAQGKCSKWFLQRLSDPEVLQALLGEFA